MNKAFVDPKKIFCVGCTACATVCPKEAIVMEQTPEGFFAPNVDEKKCVECGACVKVCPVQEKPEQRMPLEQCAGWHTDDEIRYRSTSGGVFAGLAQKVLDQGGEVFGAVYSEDFTQVYHAGTDTVSLSAVQKSKYTVSDLRDTFSKIRRHAKEGRKVLFVGTPCQCAGLRNVVGENPNVVIIDFICGGTPSAKAFRDYMNYKKKKNNAEIIAVDFRGKDTGWKKQYLSVSYANGKQEDTFYMYDPYFALFCLEHLSTRQACAGCQFRKSHMSDLTIADFWGFRATNIPDDDKGISLVAVNTQAGKELLDSFADMQKYPLDFSKIAYAYEEYSNPEAMLLKKQKFFADLSRNDFSKICRKYVKTDKLSIFLRRVKSKLKG